MTKIQNSKPVTDYADLFSASLVSSASFVLKASFRHRTLLLATGSFGNAPFVKLAKDGGSKTEGRRQKKRTPHQITGEAYLVRGKWCRGRTTDDG